MTRILKSANPNSKNSQPPRSNFERENEHLTITYREAAVITGRDFSHVRRVVTGRRKSAQIMKILAPYLKEKEAGIGRN